MRQDLRWTINVVFFLEPVNADAESSRPASLPKELIDLDSLLSEDPGIVFNVQPLSDLLPDAGSSATASPARVQLGDTVDANVSLFLLDTVISNSFQKLMV